ncbi:MAG: hypothetical protein Q8Q33_00250 [Chlamydiota bacterium]|nr:hypothetical protein [Chlamydiota bacterium]
MKFKKGLTLIEVVVMITVLALALPGLAFFFFNWKSSLSEMRLRSLGSRLAYDLMEEIASKKWDENSTTGPLADGSKTLPANLGPESGESRYSGGANTFDDVDDYHGLSEIPLRDSQGAILSAFSGFTRTVSVTYVADTNLDAPVTSVPPTHYKRVVVTVSWEGGSQSVDIVNLFSNH